MFKKKKEYDTHYHCFTCGADVYYSPDDMQSMVDLHNKYFHQEKENEMAYCMDYPNNQPKITFHNNGRWSGNTAHAIRTLLTQPKNQTGLLIVPEYSRMQNVLKHPIVEELGCFAENNLSCRCLKTKSNSKIYISTTTRRGSHYDLIVIDDFNDFPEKNQYNLKQWALEAASSEILLTGKADQFNTCKPPYEPQPFSYERFADWNWTYNPKGNDITLRSPDASQDIHIERRLIQLPSVNNLYLTHNYHYKACTDDYNNLYQDIKLFTQDQLAALWHYGNFQREVQC